MPKCDSIKAPQYVVSTYDPPEEGEPVESGWKFGWRRRLMCDGARATIRAVRHFESQGYDRDASIHVELIKQGGLDVPLFNETAPQ